MHFDQNVLFIIILVIVGIVRAFANLAEKAREKAERSGSAAPKTSAPVPRTPPETDEDRIRKFLEALGQPPGTLPPPKIERRRDIPPRPVPPVQSPSSFGRPILETWEQLKRRTEVLQQPSKSPSPEVSRKIIELAQPTAAEGNEPGTWIAEEGKRTSKALAREMRESPVWERASPRGSDRLTWRRDLLTPEGLRNAVVLREIFGPPRAFRPIESSGQA